MFGAGHMIEWREPRCQAKNLAKFRRGSGYLQSEPATKLGGHSIPFAVDAAARVQLDNHRLTGFSV